MISWVQRYFPAGAGISYPKGSFLLWVELPAAVDCVRLNERLAQRAIHVAPGSLFSASGKFRQCLRLNYAFTLTPAIEDAVRTVGELATEMVAEAHATQWVSPRLIHYSRCVCVVMHSPIGRSASRLKH